MRKADADIIMESDGLSASLTPTPVEVAARTENLFVRWTVFTVAVAIAITLILWLCWAAYRNRQSGGDQDIPLVQLGSNRNRNEGG